MEDIRDFITSRRRLNLIIVVANIVIFLLFSVIGDTNNALFMLQHGAGYTPYILAGEYYRLFTCMFLHFGISHLAYNMLCLIFLGDVLETEVGSVKYLVIYILGGLGGNLLSMGMDLRTGSFPVSAGASGAIFAVVGAILYIVIRNRGRLGTITIRRLLLMILVTLCQGLTNMGTDNAAHVGGLLAGFVLAVILYRKSGRGQ